MDAPDPPYERLDQPPRPIVAAVVDFEEEVYVSMFWDVQDKNTGHSWLACLWRHDDDPEDVWQFRCRFKDPDGEKRCYGSVIKGTEEQCRFAGNWASKHLQEKAEETFAQDVVIEARGEVASLAMSAQMKNLSHYALDDDGNATPVEPEVAKA